MKTKDKLILVAYINIGFIHIEDVSSYLEQSAKILRDGTDDSVLLYIIPVRGHESRLECINPKLVSEEEYEKARQVCAELQDRLTNLNNENTQG